MNMYKGEQATAAESSIDQQMIMLDWLNMAGLNINFASHQISMIFISMHQVNSEH